MLAGGESPLFLLAEEIALYHHENWDGTGYTPGLAGEAIPFAARIVRVADTYDALTHDRPYNVAKAADVALAIIQEDAGTKFDPAVVQALMGAASMRMCTPESQ